jgi:hypothetical protein
MTDLTFFKIMVLLTKKQIEEDGDTSDQHRHIGYNTNEAHLSDISDERKQ